MSNADLDLRHAARRRRDADELELAERLVVGRHLATRPGARGSRPTAGCPRRSRTISALLGRDRRVPVDQLREDAALGLDARGDSGVTSSRSTSLTSPLSTPPWMAAPMATTSSGLTPLCGSLPKQLLRPAPARPACGSCRRRGRRDRSSPASSPASASAGLVGPTVALDQVGGDLARASPRVERAGRGASGPSGVGGDERQVDLRRHRRARARSSPSRPPRRAAAAPSCRAARSMPWSLLELRDQPVDDRLVEVVAAEVVVAVRRLAPRRRRRRARARTRRTCRRRGRRRGSSGRRLLVEPVGERGRGRLVDDPEHVRGRRSCRRPWSPRAARR